MFSVLYSIGVGNWIIVEFIVWLKECGVFEVLYWMMKGFWLYVDNKIIIDIGVGNICFVGVVIEVLGIEGVMII